MELFVVMLVGIVIGWAVTSWYYKNKIWRNDFD